MSETAREPGFDFDGEYGRQYGWVADTVIPAYRDVFAMALSVLEGELPADARLLVVGPGPAHELVLFARARPDWRFLAVDTSAEMLGRARENVAAAGLAERVELVHGDVARLAAGERFDAATLFNVLHFVPDDGSKLALLRALAERLPPGALLLVFDLHGDPASPSFRRLMPAWERYMERRGMRGADKEAFFARIERGIHWAGEDRLAELFREAGFATRLTFFRGLLYGGWVLTRAGG